MGRKRKAWLCGGNGIRHERGRRLPGFYAYWRERRPNGDVVTHPVHFDSQKNARTFINRHNAKTELRMIGHTVPTSLGEAIVEFIQAKARKSDATRRGYQYCLLALMAFVGGGALVSDIAGKTIDGYIRSKMADGATVGTLNKHARYLHSFFKWCIKNGYANRNPVNDAETAERKSVARNRPPVTDVAIGKLVGAAEHEDHRLAILIAATTGLDRGDIEQLKPEWIDVGAGVIRGRRPKTGGAYVRSIHPDLLARLRPQLVSCPQGSCLLPGMLPRRRAHEHDWWRQLRKRAGLDATGLMFRDLRAYATNWLMSAPGMNLRHAQILLGHKSAVTTMDHYVGQDQGIAAAVQSLPLPGSAGQGIAPKKPRKRRSRKR